MVSPELSKEIILGGLNVGIVCKVLLVKFPERSPFFCDASPFHRRLEKLCFFSQSLRNFPLSMPVKQAGVFSSSCSGPNCNTRLEPEICSDNERLQLVDVVVLPLVLQALANEVLSERILLSANADLA